MHHDDRGVAGRPARWVSAAAYAAAALAFAYAAISLYWAAGGSALVGTVGGFVADAARRGGVAAVVLAGGAAALKIVAGLVAAALVRPWGRRIPYRPLRGVAVLASVVLVLYGAVVVGAGALVLGGAIHPSGAVDRTALRWHVALWDLWFLVWGLFMAAATIGSWSGLNPHEARGAGGEQPTRAGEPSD